MCIKSIATEKDITVQTDNTYHDSTGLLLHTDVTVNGTRQRVSSLTYDGLGRVIADTRGDGAAVTGTSYTYDLHGKLTSISGPGFSQRLHYADGPGDRLYNGMISSMSWTMGDDATERGYRYSYNDCNWLTAAEYGEGPSLDSHKNRYTERFTEFMPNGGVRRLQRHGLKADGEYGKVDNLHIHYEGNRIKEVLEDAGSTVQTGSTDFPGKTGVRSSFEYNAWGALVRDDGRNISSVAYDNLGNPVGVKFSTSDGSGAKYVYSAKGDRLKAEHRVNVTVQVNPVSKAPQLSDGSSVGDPQPLNPNLLVTTRLEYHGPVVYRNGKVDRVLFSGGYATIDGGNVTFHYYTQDCQGSNRAVVNGTTGAVEQTVAYYPYGGVIADLGTGAGIQPCKFGGKELTLCNGLDEYDFGARQYYPAVPHFTRIDPLCEQDYWLSPYLYCANDPVNLTDPTGMSTFVTSIGDGIYRVIGGDLKDKDKNIYVCSIGKNGKYLRGQSIGITTSTTSFYNSDKNAWEKGAIIDTHDISGKKFLSYIINNNPPLFDDYIKNARNGHPYDFKVTNGTSKAIPGINIYRGMAMGFNSNGQTIYTSARDIGNIAAGYVAAVNGLSWADARMGFDGYQFITSSKFEGLSTRNAELYGWMMGYKQTTRSQKIHNMSNSIKSPIKKSSNKLWNIIKGMFE